MNRNAKKAKLRVPLGVAVLLIGVLGMLVVGLLCYINLRYGSFAFLTDANAESEYLTIRQYEMVVSTVTPAPVATEEPTPAPTPAPTDDGRIKVSTYATLRYGDDNGSVAALHARLMELGYMDYDEVESLYTVATENAVKLFQRANDLDQTGVATPALQEMLYAENAQSYRAKRNDNGMDVKDAQERLMFLGYYTNKVSGYYGPQTETAVRLFQSKNDLPIDGEISRSTYDILYSDDVVPLATPTPTPSPTPTPRPQATKTPRVTLRPGETATPKPAATPKPTATPKVTNTPGVEKSSYGSGVSGMIACAEQQLGDPYVWGAKGPDSFDCSGLAYYCMKMAGASVSRSNAASYAARSGWTLIEDINDLKAGDLIFFKSDDSDRVSHVAICTGGKSFIHASSSKGCVCRSSIGSSDSNYWYRNFVCGRRVFG